MRFGFGHRKGPPQAEAPRIAKLLEVIKSLKLGELIEVIWLDACISRERNIFRLKNRDFATYKRSIGYYCALVCDQRYNEYHLIISIEQTDGFDEEARHDITSIPLPIVRSIKRPGEKESMIARKGRGVLMVPVNAIRLRKGKKVSLDRFGEKIVLEPMEKR